MVLTMLSNGDGLNRMPIAGLTEGCLCARFELINS